MKLVAFEVDLLHLFISDLTPGGVFSVESPDPHPFTHAQWQMMYAINYWI